MVVYKLTCMVTGKAYIGVTRQPLAKRLAGHRHASREVTMKGRYLIAEAIRVHGWEAFRVEVLAHPRSIQEMREMECAAITLHRTLYPNGYNQLNGGGGWLDRPTTTGRPAWNKGVPHSDESRQRMRDAHAGQKNFRARAVRFKGQVYRTLTDCARENGFSRQSAYRLVKQGRIEYLTPGRPGNYVGQRHPHSPEARARMSQLRSGANHYRARAIEVDGVTYPSIKDASQQSGYSYMQLKTRLKDGRAKYLTQSRYIQ